jgi:hypothetical protein
MIFTKLCREHAFGDTIESFVADSLCEEESAESSEVPSQRDQDGRRSKERLVHLSRKINRCTEILCESRG